MKKVYLFGAAFLLTLVSWGQRINDSYLFGKTMPLIYDNSSLDEFRPSFYNNDDRALNIVWTETFTGATGLTTANGTWSTSGPDGSYWSISSVTAGSNGFGLSMTGNHMYWNSYTPISPGESSFATTEVVGSVESPNIDLSSVTSTQVGITFEVNGMFCCNNSQIPWTFAISNNGGSSWSSEIPLNLGVNANENTNDIAEPVLVTRVISSYLDSDPLNNDDVRVRFTWTADAPNGAGQYSTHYYWALDNVQFFEIPEFEIQNQEMWIADIRNDYEFTTSPANQLGNLTVQNKVFNLGFANPADLTMEVTVFNSSMAIVGGPVKGGVLLNPPLTSNSVDTLTFATSIDLSALPNGTYTIRSVVLHDDGATDDATPENDILWRTLVINNNTLGFINHDASVVNDLISYTVETRTGFGFYVSNNVDLYGLNTKLNPSGGFAVNTTLDIPLNIFLENLTTGDLIGLYEYELNSSKMGNYTFNFYRADEVYDGFAPVLLEPGNEYFIGLEVLSGNYLYYDGNLGDADLSGIVWADNVYYWNGVEPHFTLNFDETLNISEEVSIRNGISVSQNMPNPFNGNTLITYNLNEASNVTLEILDVTGKVIANYDEGTRDAGEHNITINGSELAEGIYFYTFTAGEYKVTKRMVVNK